MTPKKKVNKTPSKKSAKKTKITEEQRLKDLKSLLLEEQELNKRLQQVEKELEKVEDKLPKLVLDDITLEIENSSDDCEDSENMKAEDLIGIGYECAFISARELRDKVLPFLNKHFKDFPK